MNVVSFDANAKLVGPAETKADAFFLFGRRCARMGLKRETAQQVLGTAPDSERIQRFWAGFDAPKKI